MAEYIGSIYHQSIKSEPCNTSRNIALAKIKAGIVTVQNVPDDLQLGQEIRIKSAAVNNGQIEIYTYLDDETSV